GAMKYDLLVTDGEVLDPAAGLKGQLDVAISGGKIVEVAASLPKNESRRMISARGLLVTPGLIDIHAHIFVNAHDMGGHTDHFCQQSGVTTLCDAGSTGSATFAGLRAVIDGHVRTRARAFVNLSAIGIVGTANGIMGPARELILKEVVEAPRHGIVFDCAHRRNHFSFPMIEKALDQGFLPDTISTDLTFTSATKGPVWDMATTMSKLLHFGMSLDDLVQRATAAPARILGYEGTVGTLKPGANADIA